MCGVGVLIVVVLQVHVLGHCLHAMVQAFVAKEEATLSDGSLQVS